MAEHIWTVLCQRRLVDPEINSTSLMDVSEIATLTISNKWEFDHITGAAKIKGTESIIFPIECRLISWWVRSDKKVSESPVGRISIEHPGGTVRVVGGEFQINLEASETRRLDVKFEALAVSNVGRYWFILEEKKKAAKGAARWNRVARVPLEVEVLFIDQGIDQAP